MTTSQAYNNTYTEYTPIQGHSSETRPTSLTEGFEVALEEDDIVPGRILFLPNKVDLPKGAVKRVTTKGNGAVEDGVYRHPVVVISRPAKESTTVHFQLVSRGH